MISEDDFLKKLSLAVGQEDYNRDSIKGRFSQYKQYMKERFRFKCPIIIVGGTNGKGEVSQTISRLAKQNQIKAAVWTSPHIESVVERYEYNGEFIDYPDLIQRITNELENSKVKLSFFEILFTTFCQWAADIQPDLLILEVGLGGRLDATNVFDADVSIITSISRDHIQFLGGSYRGILNEKFEIARKAGFFIGQSQLGYIREMMQVKANKLGCDYQIISQQEKENFSQVNTRIAKLAFEKIYKNKNLDIDEQPRVDSFRHLVEFNGAHNLDGMRQLMHSLCQQENLKKGELILSFSKRSNQEIIILLKTVRKYQDLFTKITMSFFNHTRALEEEASRQLAADCGIFFEKDWKRKINENIRQGSPVLVAGSYYFVGEVKRYLNDFAPESISTKTPV